MDSTSISSNGSNGDGPERVPLTFARADQMYVSLKHLHETGVLTNDAFDEQLKQMMVQDSTGRWWSKSRDNGDWYYYDDTDWVRGTPPVESLSAPPVEAPIVPPIETPIESPIEQTTLTLPITPITDGGAEDLNPNATEDLGNSGGLIDPGKIDVTSEPFAFPGPSSDPAPDPVYIPPLAGMGSRTLAWVIDFAIVLVANIVLSAIGAGSLAFVVSVGYYVYYWSTTGQTLGMKSQNIRVMRTDGKPLTWGTGAVRYVGYFIGSLCILIGLLWVYWDPKHQGWHDKMAQTLVVRNIQ